MLRYCQLTASYSLMSDDEWTEVLTVQFSSTKGWFFMLRCNSQMWKDDCVGPDSACEGWDTGNGMERFHAEI